MKLSKGTLSRLRRERTRRDYKDDAMPGLWITVLPSPKADQPSAVLTWSVRYKFEGRDRRYTIGKAPPVDVPTARKVAGDILRKAATGVDPQAQKTVARRRARAGLDRIELFGAVFDRYLDQYVRRHLKASTQKEIERMANRIIIPRLGRRELKNIEPREIRALLSAQASTTANRVHSLLLAFFNWAKSELIVTENPVAGMKKPSPEKSRDRILTDQEIRWFWRGCDKLGFPFGYLFQILLLSAARRAEVGGMLRDELDEVAHTWTLPGTRTKNGRAHVITITPEFEKILDRIPYKGEFVFGRGDRPPSGWSKAKLRLDKLMAEYAAEDFEQVPQPWRIHDLRRTAASGMAKIGVALPVVERCLNHVSESFGGLKGVYQRHSFDVEMAAAFRSWSDHVAKIAANGRAKASYP